MSYKETLQQHNTDLQGLIDKANALPDAGGGSGGGSVETCTVQIPASDTTCVYTTIENDAIISKATSITTSITITCLCESMLVLIPSRLNVYFSVDKASLITYISGISFYHIDALASETVTFTIVGGGSAD